MADHSQPTTAAIVIATTIIAGLGGYFIGQASLLGIFRSGNSSPQRRKRPEYSSRDKRDTDTEVSSDSEDDDAAGAANNEQNDLHDFDGEGDECKLTLVVRTDLGMTKGKIAAQCSHATLACYKSLLRSSSAQSLLGRWERQGQAKVALQIKDEDGLELLQAQAVSLGLCAQVVHDAGRTQIASGSATVLGVGPGPNVVIDQVTGGLKLL